ncbi:MAG: glycosyltransferase family 4 protein [Thermogemmata sp.]
MNILFMNQYFWPDVAATAQHAADLARELARRGHRVDVLCGRRAYDNPGRRFKPEEQWEGIRIHRVAHTGFGKGARWRRAADFLSFCAACAWRLLSTPGFDVVVAMTTPPLLSFLAACFVKLKGGRLCLWVMDLNPDQAVAAGWLRAGSLTHRLLERSLGWSLRNAAGVVALDRFMRDRLVAKGAPEDKVQVVAPWTHDAVVAYDEMGRERFRRRHGLEGKFVVMYSGNHSPCHPLDTLLEAARRLEGRPEIAFCFVGGGSEFERVRRSGLANVVTVGYQPLKELSASLSAADLHVVVMGEPFVGIVHPCKIYNILRLGIPVLYIGPQKSHVMDLAPRDAEGRWLFTVPHGAPVQAAEQILAAMQRAERGAEDELAVASGFQQEATIARLYALLSSLNHNEREGEP